MRNLLFVVWHWCVVFEASVLAFYDDEYPVCLILDTNEYLKARINWTFSRVLFYQVVVFFVKFHQHLTYFNIVKHTHWHWNTIVLHKLQYITHFYSQSKNINCFNTICIYYIQILLLVINTCQFSFQFYQKYHLYSDTFNKYQYQHKLSVLQQQW